MTSFSEFLVPGSSLTPGQYSDDVCEMNKCEGTGGNGIFFNLKVKGHSKKRGSQFLHFQRKKEKWAGISNTLVNSSAMGKVGDGDS